MAGMRLVGLGPCALFDCVWPKCCVLFLSSSFTFPFLSHCGPSPSVYHPSSNMSDDEHSESPGTPTATTPIDRAVVVDALREILGEIPSFRALMASGSSSSGSSVSAATSPSAVTVPTVTPSSSEGGKFSYTSRLPFSPKTITV